MVWWCAWVIKLTEVCVGQIGKWHLGIGRQYQFMPTNQGYDVFWGVFLNCKIEAVVHKAMKFLIEFMFFQNKDEPEK